MVGGRDPAPHLSRTLSEDDNSGSSRVAHTLTACSRCRHRKTRCDPGLPRCGPCERTNAVCEYWDPAKRQHVGRDYVVWLQHRANELEKEIDRLENQDVTEDPELMVRNAAAVRVQDADESKFLGPSSGTQITRLVMQLAKQFTDAKTIKEIVPDARARQVQELYAVEAAKPTSKIYPLVSSVAAEDLPNKEIIDLLYQLYCLKVQPMYPALHEPTLAADMQAAQDGTADAYQNFITRMVIAVSLQKMDTQYAGLADSYYLAALKYMEDVVRAMNLQTLQAFALIAEYSLLTPTRTAIYYICGLAVRLVQTLGIHEEFSIDRLGSGATADPLEIDMRRRVFWCIFAMESGLQHALGRPVSLASSREHLDVKFFELCDDKYITKEGILPGARPILKKWIAVHFFKMRLLQIEVRRKLYLNKRPAPKDDEDPWFKDFQARLDAWRDAVPDVDEGHGLDKVWFTGRYNTIIVFLYRPSPQIPRPSVNGALNCFEASKYNIYMVREQIKRKNVDLTWIFTQALFMAINTMLWSLSYVEVRKRNPKHEVEQHLTTGLDSVRLAVDRWPGVASAHALYVHIIAAIMKIYDKDGDVPLSTSTPSDSTSPSMTTDSLGRSRTTSPSFSQPIPQDMVDRNGSVQLIHRQSRNSDYLPNTPGRQVDQPHVANSSPSIPNHDTQQETPRSHQNSFDQSHFQPLPDDFANFSAASGWNQNYIRPGPAITPYDPYAMPNSAFASIDDMNAYNPQTYDFAAHPNGVDSNHSLQQQASTYLDPNYWNASVTATPEFGLSVDQQMELMQNLETHGMGDMRMMIDGANRLWNPSQTRESN